MRWLIVAMLLLAGCTTPDEPSDYEQSIVELTDPGDVTASQDPGNYIHNYWNDQPTRTVVDDTVSLTYGGVSQCPTGTFPNPLNCQEIMPIKGAMVPIGTLELEFKASWPASVAIELGQIDVYYEFPLPDGSFLTGTQRLENGDVRYVTIDSSHADLPHTLVTKWRFWGSMATGVWGQTYDVDVDIVAVRGDDPLPIFPAPPDHWHNESRITLNQYGGPFSEILGQGDTPLSNGHPGYAFHPTRLVPLETARVVVNVYLNLTSDDDLAPSPVLAWHGGDRNQFEEDVMAPTGIAQSGGNFHYAWTLNLESRHWDNPYATQTHWQIFVDWHGGVGPASLTMSEGTADIHVEAIRA